MNWFKKSSPARHENPHRQQKHTRAGTSKNAKLTKSHSLPLPNKQTDTKSEISKILRLASCQHIEVVDPELFFQDPDHIRNYKEEEEFLNIMSDWVIVENPATALNNFFSADFEEEFLQAKMQQQPAEVRSASEAALLTQAVSEPADKSQWKCLSRKRTHKRSLAEILFADKIELGLVPPMKTPSLSTTNMTTPPSSYTSSPKVLKKRRRLKSQTEDLSHEDSFSIPPTCSVGIIKDCAINRSQLKTEALACSIMGAIGKCPAKDKTPGSSLKNLIHETGDTCHPINNCDHYDIKQFFRLDDNGNILLNMSHIEEIRGFGYASAEDTRLYRQYLGEGYIAEENAFRVNKFCLQTLKRIFTLFWNKIKCK